MAGPIIGKNEVEINGQRYKTTGPVQPQLLRDLAEKQVVGDYSKDSNPRLSSWNTSDFRGGMLMEDMDEGRDDDRFYWSDCITEYRGHLTLPRLASEVFLPIRSVPSAVNDPDAGWTNEANLNDENTGTVASSSSIYVGNKTEWIECDIAAEATADSIRYFLSDPAGGRVLSIDIDIEVSAAWTELVTDLSPVYAAWTVVPISGGQDITSVRFRFKLVSGANTAISFREVELQLRLKSWSSLQFANFNGELYCGVDTTLCKLISGAAWFEYITTLDASITSMVSSLNNRLYIFIGDSDNYYWMDTADALTQSNSAGHYAIQWDAKLLKSDSSGDWSHSTDPDGGAPTWADSGDITDMADAELNYPFLYQDSTGADIIYVPTVRVLKAHDFTNTQWVDAKVKMPENPNGGKGALYWETGAFISSGLDILEYRIGAQAIVLNQGLNKDGGLPVEYNGEVIKILDGGVNQMFALVDSTQTTGSSKSSVVSWDGTGWRTAWSGSSNNEVMYNGVVSSAQSTYGFYFDSGNVLYRIPLFRGIRNPNKLSTFTYAASGTHLTPWFDAAWVGNKLALKFKIKVVGASANETVVVKFREDHTNTDIDSGWTTLGTITSDGETEYTFGSGAGVTFKEIQFKFELARGGTSTNTPDIQYFSLEYQRVVTPTWGYGVQLDLTHATTERPAGQIIDLLETAAETETLVTFYYEDVTAALNVQVQDVRGAQTSGKYRQGIFDVTLIRPAG